MKSENVVLDFNDRDFLVEPLQVLSFGGGVQSSAMLLMIGEGTLPKPDLVLFADTGSEMPHTIEHIENVVKPYCKNVLKLPFHTVRSHRGSLHEDYMNKQALPMVAMRSCTGNFKIDPQRRFIRTIVGRKNGKKLADSWLGITTDEANRKPSHKDVREPKWIDLAYPLLDLVPTSREECIEINAKYGWNVVKSGCFCCPYSSSQQWRNLRDNHPDLFEICLEMERLKNERRPGKWGLHRERSLDTIDDWDLPEASCENDGGCFI